MPAAIDLLGQTFGRLTVEEIDNTKNKRSWRCKCICGSTSIVSTYDLRSGHITSCGCSRRNDLSGRVFDRWSVVKYSHTDTNRVAYWLCECSCGILKTVSGVLLRSGGSKSCGCYQREIQRKKHMLPYGKAAAHQAYRVIQSNAKNRGYVMEVSEDDFVILSQKPCYYCGSPPSNVCRPYESSGAFIYNGLDRRDNSKGYTLDNVVPCCRICNVAKNKMPEDAFYAWIKQLINYQINKGLLNA